MIYRQYNSNELIGQKRFPPPPPLGFFFFFSQGGWCSTYFEYAHIDRHACILEYFVHTTVHTYTHIPRRPVVRFKTPENIAIHGALCQYVLSNMTGPQSIYSTYSIATSLATCLPYTVHTVEYSTFAMYCTCTR